MLGGLWHGASWNFLIWGGYHGTLLAIERALSGERPPADEWNWTYPIRASLTFVQPLLMGILSCGRLQQKRSGPTADDRRRRAVLLSPGISARGPGLDSRGREEKSEWFERAPVRLCRSTRARSPRCCSAWKSSACWMQPFPCLLQFYRPMGGGVCTIESSKQITTKIASPDATIISDTPFLLTRLAIEGPSCYRRFSSEIPAAEHVTPRQNCPTAVSDVSELRAASIISDTPFPER